MVETIFRSPVSIVPTHNVMSLATIQKNLHYFILLSSKRFVPERDIFDAK